MISLDTALRLVTEDTWRTRGLIPQQTDIRCALSGLMSLTILRGQCSTILTLSGSRRLTGRQTESGLLFS